MDVFLGECPVYTIMLIGRWSSDAFLRYIRKQVEQFSHNDPFPISQAHSGPGANSVAFGSQAEKSPVQRQDKKKHWW